ncbi:MAG: hypothetical protein JWQ09_69 [Segetibacter sp.]|nr:hypothetical protein [Segetibacter sp.]
METINDLIELLLYQVKNLYSAEEQILQAFPSFIEKANHNSLKNALKHHAAITNEQKERLTQIPQLIKEKRVGTSISEIDEVSFASFTSKGMLGLREEINQLLETNRSNEVKHAAIIASVHKIEHYEICAYGTAFAYAKQMSLHAVAELLDETLQEEYDADDLLTALATAALNKEALPEGIDSTDENSGTNETEADYGNEATKKVSISERTINSPGGRAGTSHRGYGSGESRGH